MKRSLFEFLIIAIILFSCKKDTTQISNNPVPVVSYECIDSMKVDTFLQNHIPELYNKYKDKVYQVKNTNAYVTIQQRNAFIQVTVVDPRIKNYETEISFLLKVKSINDFSGIYSLTDTSVTHSVYLTGGIGTQRLGNPNGWLFMPNTKTGKITLEYNRATKSVNGLIEDIKMPWGEYIPYYLSGAINYRTSDALWLIPCGSSRSINVSFNNIPFIK